MRASLVIGLLVAGFALSDRITHWAEHGVYGDETIYSETTPYQRIVLTQWHDDMRLYLNGNLQFSSRDEHRYHEALIHPTIEALPWAKRVLVLGGGDGLAVRELLKHHNLEQITLVDLDPAMTKLFSTSAPLVKLNQGALKDPRVHVINDDAVRWLESNADVYDAIVVDFPDPTNFSRPAVFGAGVPAARTPPVGERLRGDPVDLAIFRAARVLDHHRDAARSRSQHVAVPLLRAVVRRLGLRGRRQAPRLHGADALRGAHALARRADGRRDVPLPGRHAGAADVAERTQRPAARAPFRRRLETRAALMDRRTFLVASAAASLAACGRTGWIETTPHVGYPGMREGHALRDHATLPPPSGTIETDVAILGAGAAGLSCAWQLARAGHQRFTVLAGPEFGGNAAGGRFGDLGYPKGAHYLPLPSLNPRTCATCSPISA